MTTVVTAAPPSTSEGQSVDWPLVGELRLNLSCLGY